MKRGSMLVVAAALLVAGLAQSVAAAPSPQYTVSCVVGGNTTATWQRVRMDQVDFAWSGSGVFDPTSVSITAKAHHGFVFSTTPWDGSVAPTTVTVTFTHDGTTDQVEAACSS